MLSHLEPEARAALDCSSVGLVPLKFTALVGTWSAWWTQLPLCPSRNLQGPALHPTWVLTRGSGRGSEAGVGRGSGRQR